MSPAAARRRTGLPDCPPDVQAGCQVRMAALEQSVRDLQQSNRKLEQSNRELSEAVRAGIAESHRRSAALDDLANKLLVQNGGIKLVRKTGTHPAIEEPKP